MWNNGERNIKVEQAEFIGMGPLSGDSSFNMEVRTVKKKVSKACLMGWLKYLSKDGLLKRSWRCLISLGLVLMKVF